MKAIGDFAGFNFSLKEVARNSSFQPNVQFRRRLGIGNVPHFGLRLATQFRSLVSRRMDLKGKCFFGVENFYEQRESAVRRWCIAQEFLRMVFHQPVEVLSSERAI